MVEKLNHLLVVLTGVLFDENGSPSDVAKAVPYLRELGYHAMVTNNPANAYIAIKFACKRDSNLERITFIAGPMSSGVPTSAPPTVRVIEEALEIYGSELRVRGVPARGSVTLTELGELLMERRGFVDCGQLLLGFNEDELKQAFVLRRRFGKDFEPFGFNICPFLHEEGTWRYLLPLSGGREHGSLKEALGEYPQVLHPLKPLPCN